MSYTFTKSTCEKYTIQSKEWSYAIFIIDENGGIFSCQSDYGDYQYRWTNHGRKSFKHFLIEISKDPRYLLFKVSDENHFNFDKTIDDWHKIILKWRKSGKIEDKIKARDAYDFISDIDRSSADVVYNDLYNSHEMESICDCITDCFDVCMEYPHSAIAFSSEIMPVFAEILKNEIDTKGDDQNK